MRCSYLMGFLLCAGSALQLHAQQGVASLPTAPSQTPLSGRNSQSGSVGLQQSTVPGTTQSVNTLNSNLVIQGAFAESISGERFEGSLGIGQAIALGLKNNLGLLDQGFVADQASAQVWQVRSVLLPNLSANFKEVDQKANLAAQGLRSGVIPGVQFPTVVGPYNYFDLRASLSQNVLDLTAIHNLRSTRSSLQAARLGTADAQDVVIFAVAGTYLEVLAAQARVESARANLRTAKAVYDQARQRQEVGLNPMLDVNRSAVSFRTQQQRLVTLESDLTKRKLNLSRIIGIAPESEFNLSDEVPFSPAPLFSYADAYQIAISSRLDLKQAEASLTAARQASRAAQSERLPSLRVNGDYGEIGVNPAQAKPTYSVSGSIQIPLWAGGKTQGDIRQAAAAVAQHEAEISELRARIGAELRSTLLDIQSAQSQVQLARQNQDVAQENVRLTEDRFQSGVTDSVEVLQAEDSLSASNLDYITSLLAYNLSKLSLARQLGGVQNRWQQLLPIHQKQSAQAILP